LRYLWKTSKKEAKFAIIAVQNNKKEQAQFKKKTGKK